MEAVLARTASFQRSRDLSSRPQIQFLDLAAQERLRNVEALADEPAFLFFFKLDPVISTSSYT